MEICKRCACLFTILIALCLTTGLLAADIGVAWEGKSGMANSVMKGFTEGLKGSGINVETQKDLANVEELGKMLAESVIDVLIKKKAVKDVPFKFDPEPIFYLNGKTYSKLGLEIPPNILGAAKIVQ